MNTFIVKTPRPPRSGGARAEQKLQTRAAVLEAARALFAERGFETTTIRDVAARAGVATGTVFVHAPNKAALLAATLDDQLDRTLSTAWSTLPDGSARARIGHVVLALYRMYARSPKLSRVLVKESLFAPDPDGAAAARLAAFAGALGGIAASELRAGLDPEQASAGILAAYFGCLVEGLHAARPDAKKMIARFDALIAPWFAERERGARR